jgi:hypothetical protein
MKVRRWLLDKPCAAHSFLVQTLGAHAQMRLKISREDSK